jgi:hypothetical protein
MEMDRVSMGASSIDHNRGTLKLAGSECARTAKAIFSASWKVSESSCERLVTRGDDAGVSRLARTRASTSLNNSGVHYAINGL